MKTETIEQIEAKVKNEVAELALEIDMQLSSHCKSNHMIFAACLLLFAFKIKDTSSIASAEFKKVGTAHLELEILRRVETKS